MFCYEYDPFIPTDLPVEEQISLLYEGVLVICNDVFARAYGASGVHDVIGKTQQELFGGERESTHRLFR